jgi:hypothetical protein
MNPDLKDLRVAVVPSETDNGIDQSSTYEEIVACEETSYYSVPDYFKAQNDEELPAQHWSFLLDYNKKVDITGANTDGIDYHQRAIDIAYIKKVIAEHGETTSTDMELDSCPCLYSKGNRTNISELVEEYRKDGVETITYVDDQNDGYNFYAYDDPDLTDDIIAEIRQVMEEYEAEQLKTEKRCAD